MRSKSLINCLMLKTSDQRKFFTHENNFPQLVEFAKTCEAEISVVRAQNVKILELEELAKSICDHHKINNDLSYEVLEIKITPVIPPKTRQEKLNKAKEIYMHIKSSFLSGDIVSLSSLENKFKSFGLSKATMCNHMARVRKELQSRSHSIIKVRRGQYRLENTK
jgi:hypothetical protein